MSKVSIPDEARQAAFETVTGFAKFAARDEFYDQVIQKAIDAAAPHIIAAELRRIADTIDDIPDPAGDAWLRAETAGRREVRRLLIARATELRETGGGR